MGLVKWSCCRGAKLNINKDSNTTIKYKINPIKVPICYTLADLKNKVINQLQVKPEELVSFKILKKSIDARKKPNIFYTYSVVVELPKGISLAKPIGRKTNSMEIELFTEENYLEKLLFKRDKKRNHHENYSTVKEDLFLPPIIVGTGPAGLFCGYLLALAGLRPLLLERGADVDQRKVDVEEFWKTGLLHPDSNVQFGEGGAGTFSDGKLNTLVKDKLGRNSFILETLVNHGAPKEILFQQKPHVGTDILTSVVKNMRKSIENLGGRVEFHTKLVDITYISPKDNGIHQSNLERLTDKPAPFTEKANTILKLTTTNPKTSQPTTKAFHTHHLVLAIGHSARDTFEMLYRKEMKMSAKSFAVGLRIEHPQELINRAQYGDSFEMLPAASYKLTENLDNGRGVYSFCMCPGGVVVIASSEEKSLVVNGMSDYARDGKNANSAIVVTVSPEDFSSHHPLMGIEFQRNLEKKAYDLGEGKVPVQKLGDFLLACNLHPPDCCIPNGMFNFTPSIKGRWTYADLSELFPPEIRDSLGEGIVKMSSKIEGFSHPNALLSGVESRTSSPVKIHRDENFQSNLKGIYPCGEGAGYAGGITSAAMDGLKVAEWIISNDKEA